MQKRGKTNTPPTTSQRRCKVYGTPIEHRCKDAVFCEQKQCKNSESNPRHNFKRRVNQSIDNTLLFEFGEVFRPTPQQREMIVYLNIQVGRKTTKQDVR